jgi:hypothetical protein
VPLSRPWAVSGPVATEGEPTEGREEERVEAALDESSRGQPDLGFRWFEAIP